MLSILKYNFTLISRRDSIAYDFIQHVIYIFFKSSCEHIQYIQWFNIYRICETKVNYFVTYYTYQMMNWEESKSVILLNWIFFYLKMCWWSSRAPFHMRLRVFKTLVEFFTFVCNKSWSFHFVVYGQFRQIIFLNE